MAALTTASRQPGLPWVGYSIGGSAWWTVVACVCSDRPDFLTSERHLRWKLQILAWLKRWRQAFLNAAMKSHCN